MKKTIAVITVCLMATPAYADSSRIESPRGISQSAWNASSTYLNFQCPANTSRGEGADMNFTTDRGDDFYFVECEPITVVIPNITIPYVPIVADTPTVAAPDSSTAIAPVTSSTVITTTETTTATSNTSINVIDFNASDWFAQLMAWFDNFIKQFYAILEGLKK